MFEDGHLLLVLHAPPQPDEDERQGRFYWREPTGVWHSSEGGTGPQVLDRHLSDYAELLESYDVKEANATTSEDYFDVLEALAPLHRATRNLHRVLQDARKLCPSDRDIINYRDRSYELERTGDLLYSETKNQLDFVVAKQVEGQAKASHRLAIAAHRLNLLAAFFFPIATLSAIFGVNMTHGFEKAGGPGPFLVLIAVGLVMGILLTSIVSSKPTSLPEKRVKK